ALRHPAPWAAVDHTPIALLDRMPTQALEDRATQLGLHSRINYAYRRMQEYLHTPDTWAGRHAGVLRARPVAYFSAEFGLHESLPIYSGGLGVLSGDHIKSASDLGVPLRSEDRATQLGLHSRINYAYRRMQEYLHTPDTWAGRHAGVLRARPVAYFSAEFGLHESLPIYSGGLGVLSGDHIKSASDLGVPL